MDDRRKRKGQKENGREGRDESDFRDEIEVMQLMNEEMNTRGGAGNTRPDEQCSCVKSVRPCVRASVRSCVLRTASRPIHPSPNAHDSIVPIFNFCLEFTKFPLNIISILVNYTHRLLRPATSFIFVVQ